jgi:flagellar hook-associated protein 1
VSISSAINAARSGLLITGLRADTAATNVANASTPGYVRRAVGISETLLGGQTAGVHSTGIVRGDNASLTLARRAMSSDLAQSNLLSANWQSISSRIGDSLDGVGLFSKLAAFESALTRASATPESTSEAAALLSAAKGVASEFNQLSDFVTKSRSDADREIATGVETVNAALRKVQDLNTRIASSNRTTSQAAALFDERQRVLDSIAEFMPIETVERHSGTIDVLTPEGVYLLTGTPREISFTPSVAFGPNQTLASGSLSGLTVGDIVITPGATTYSAVSGGAFAALFQLRDQDLPALSAQLDTIAGDLAARLSDDAVDPTKAPGAPGLFVDLDPSAGNGLAGRLAVNAAADPAQGGALWRLRDGLGSATQGPPGNNTILSAMLGALTDVRSINANGILGSFSSTEMAAHLSSLTGQARVSQDAVNTSVQAQFGILVEAEQSGNGVNIDDEMQDLLLIEQAYAANARVIEVASQMLNRLMEL